MQKTLALIKPDVCGKPHTIVTTEVDEDGQETKTEEVSPLSSEKLIVAKIQESGLTVVRQKLIQLTKSQAQSFYAEHKNRSFYEGLVSFMTSGPLLALELEGENAIKTWRTLLGPTNSDKARELAPESIRAQFGTDGRRNAGHGSDSEYSAARELEFFFPAKNTLERAACRISSSAAGEGKAEAITQCIVDNGFLILGQKTDPNDSSVFVCVEKMNATYELKMLIGPTDEEQAKSVAPQSIRAMFGANSIDAQPTASIAEHFPNPFEVQHTLALMKPGFTSEEETAIRGMMKANGFTIIAEQRLILTRRRAEEFYGEHKGRSFFNNLVKYMTSGPVIAFALAKPGAIKAWRLLMGPTNTFKARELAPNSIRALFGKDGTRNATHGSDSPTSAARELSFYFPRLLVKRPNHDGISYIKETGAGKEKTFLEVLNAGLVELCRQKPAPSKEALRFLGNWLIENNPRAVLRAEQKAEDEQRMAEEKAAEEEEAAIARRKLRYPHHGAKVNSSNIVGSKVVFVVGSIEQSILDVIENKFGFSTVNAIESKNEEVKIAMKKSANNKFLIKTPVSLDAMIKLEQSVGEVKFVLHCTTQGEDGAGENNMNEAMAEIKKFYRSIGRYRAININDDAVIQTQVLDSYFQSQFVFFIGGPGCGKSTMATKACNEFGYDYISIGNILREKCESGTDEGNDLARVIKNGQLVQDSYIMGLLKETISKSSNSRFILDGFPRNLKQAQLFEKTFGCPQFVISLQASDETMLARDAPNQEAIASSKLRIKTYHRKSEALMGVYSNASILNFVDAEVEPIKVYNQVRAFFKSKVVLLSSDASSDKYRDARKEIGAMVQNSHDYLYLSLDDLWRAEMKRGTELGSYYSGLKDEGAILDPSKALALLSKTCSASETSKIVIDNYLHGVDQANAFQSSVADFTFVAQVRAVDDIHCNKALADHFGKTGKLRVIHAEDSEASVKEAFSQKIIIVSSGLDELKIGTSLESISKNFGHRIISISSLLESEKDRGTSLAEAASDEVTLQLVRSILMKNPNESTFLMPLEDLSLDLITKINSSLVKCSMLDFRASDRNQEAMWTASQESSEEKESDGAEEGGDGTPSVISQKLQAFHDRADPIVNYFKENGSYSYINCDASTEDVWSETKKLFEPTLVLIDIANSVAEKDELINLICKGHKCAHVDVDKLVAAEIDSKTEDGNKMASYLSSGFCIPLEDKLKVVRAFIRDAPTSQFILSGLPCQALMNDGYPLAHDQVHDIEQQIGCINRMIKVRSNEDKNYDSPEFPVEYYFQKIGKYEEFNVDPEVGINDDLVASITDRINLFLDHNALQKYNLDAIKKEVAAAEALAEQKAAEEQTYEGDEGKEETKGDEDPEGETYDE